MEIVLDIIHGDSKINDFMHVADVFEESKQIGMHEQYKISGTPDIQKIVSIIKEGFEKSGRNVSFVAIRSIDGEVFHFPSPYIKPSVNSISDGHKWGLFKSLLEGLGYRVETDEHMCVTHTEYRETYRNEKEWLSEEDDQLNF